jgi:hypothetical protein
VVLDDVGGVRCYAFGLAVCLDVAAPQDTDPVLEPVSDPQTAIGERPQATYWALRELVSPSRYITFEANAIESKETVIGAYPQKSIRGLRQRLRSARIPLLFAPRTVRKLVDVATRIERTGRGDDKRKVQIERERPPFIGLPSVRALQIPMTKFTPAHSFFAEARCDI